MLVEARDRIVTQRLVTASNDFTGPVTLTVYLVSPPYQTFLKDVLITMSQTGGNANHTSADMLSIQVTVLPANKDVWTTAKTTDGGERTISAKTPHSLGAPTKAGGDLIAANSFLKCVFTPTLSGAALPEAVTDLYVAAHLVPA